MEKRNDKRDKLQDVAVSKWEEAGYRGAIISATGTGKTWIFMKGAVALSKALGRKINVRYIAEVTRRQDGVRADIDKFKELKGIDLKEIMNIEFMCYHSACKEEHKARFIDLVVLDEFHDAFGSQRVETFRWQKSKFLMGITATEPGPGEVFTYKEQTYRKRDLIDKNMKVCFRCSLEKAEKEGVVAPYKVHVIEIMPGKEKLYEDYRGVPRSEEELLDQYQARIDDLRSRYSFGNRLKNIYNQRARFMYDLHSKRKVTKRLLKLHQDDRKIVFACSLPFLKEILPYRVVSGAEKKRSESILNSFNTGKINSIGSFKLLQQGENLNNINHNIIASYYSQEGNYVQRIGRTTRWEAGKEATIIILRMKYSPDEVWYRKMTKSSEKSRERVFKNISEYEEFVRGNRSRRK